MKFNKYQIFLIVLIFISNGSITLVSAQEKKKFIVALDAGHGGHDPGNRGNGYKEKDIALKVVLAVGEALQQEGDFEIVYTRKTDKFIELHERGNIVQKPLCWDYMRMTKILTLRKKKTR